MPNTSANDDNQVRPHIAQEVDYWCAKFACSEEDLRQAVSEVGTRAEDVRQYLTGSGSGGDS